MKTTRKGFLQGLLGLFAVGGVKLEEEKPLVLYTRGFVEVPEPTYDCETCKDNPKEPCRFCDDERGE